MIKYIYIGLLALYLYMLLSCSTTTSAVSTDTNHVNRELLIQMDSIISSRMVIRQDSSFRESVLRQLQSIVEKSDTSRFVVTNAEGDTIRERIIINNVREVTSETERLEREVIMHRLETIDSTLTVMQRQMEKSDSLQQVINEKETIIRQQGIFDRIRQYIMFCITTLFIVALVWLVITVRKRKNLKLF
jgi:hypothetical protein